ncbi:efflux RND transporter permease subunit [Dinghuibacter silviterrae]|uniref:Multidrug efflux pump subunit AcrB n=1 Tax=Dinghuibacter silviterrae TaxID=1539049 RepID=A0A4R8DSJ8_9BACT|nr:efflux RND transporter permease subunit [Dinghuibacter silviterrae]TDX01200.1 multidrug efflux pump subunit AcrB [Dinghuibacter silviterrae]
MWIVRLALRRPYSVAVMALLILIMGILSIKSMNVDIFPVIDIPVVSEVWNYPGLSAADMEKRVVLLSERGISTTVNGVERIESVSQPGIGMLKVYFQKGADIGAAIAQMSATAQLTLRLMPPGMTAPTILQFNASNLPVAQVTMKSKTLPEDKIFDYGLNFIRVRLFTVPGLSTPAPFGGKTREIVVDVDPKATEAKGLSTMDVVNSLQTSNVIVPAGTARMGSREYNVTMNSSPDLVSQFNDMPVKAVNGQVVRMGEVAKVYDGYADQENVVRVDRKRAAYLTILKKADASTLMVVEAAKSMIPQIQETAPKGLELNVDFDQSVFVREAISSVLHEAVTAAILVSLMILFFLGNWRSVIVVCTSIPLSILVAVIFLKLSGNTLNIMTLGGLSLAVGMLVDDATVEVENIERNRNLGRPLTIAILVGAQEIAVPALMATLAICIVFFPVVLLTGPSQYLFIPMSLSVVVSMMASYILSRTLVPVLSRMLMAGLHPHGTPLPESAGAFKRWSHGFNAARDRGFDRFRDAYGRILHLFLKNRTLVLSMAFVILCVSLFLLKTVGTDFFPSTDAGMMKLHFRAPVGSRIEETERIVDSAEARIQKIIAPGDLKTINDMLGVPTFYNLAFVQTDNASSMDGEILVALQPDHKIRTDVYQALIRKDLADHFPGCTAYFQSADIVTQVLNFGLSAPIDIQIQNSNYDQSYAFARRLQDSLRTVPGMQDVTIKQVLDYPTFKINVDRVRAGELGLTQRDVANNLLVALSSSTLVDPSYYINPTNNVNYVVAVKVPYQQLTNVNSLLNTPLTNGAGPLVQNVGATPTDLPMAQAQTLRNLATVNMETEYNQISHYTVQRVMDITANVDGSDLGTVSDAIDRKIAGLGTLPTGMHIFVRGQPDVMHHSFQTLSLGLILSIILVYLLMVVLFQSWLDPFIILFAVPGALIGILWMLTITGTTINVVSLMGAIVAVGIAVSNSILMVSFANEVRVKKGLNALDAALEAGRTRLRPVLMTAIAMILGMIPMSLGTGAGGEQNAPLGRAVIGGLLVATVVTLFIVPVIYAVLRKAPPNRHSMDTDFQSEIADMDIYTQTQNEHI